MAKDNFLAYDPTMQTYDPLAQPFSYFYISIAGQIESGEFLNLDGLSVKYAFVAGDEWNIANGESEG